jgi:hypothetical protein
MENGNASGAGEKVVAGAGVGFLIEFELKISMMYNACTIYDVSSSSSSATHINVLVLVLYGAATLKSAAHTALL